MRAREAVSVSGVLPPLYKYLNIEGAKKALGNICFRFAEPSEYEDLEDMTAQSLFPDELKTALKMFHIC